MSTLEAIFKVGQAAYPAVSESPTKVRGLKVVKDTGNTVPREDLIALGDIIGRFTNIAEGNHPDQPVAEGKKDDSQNPDRNAANAFSNSVLNIFETSLSESEKNLLTAAMQAKLKLSDPQLKGMGAKFKKTQLLQYKAAINNLSTKAPILGGFVEALGDNTKNNESLSRHLATKLCAA